MDPAVSHQWTEVGVSGRRSLPVPRPVVAECSLNIESVTIPGPVWGGPTVWGQPVGPTHAMNMHALSTLWTVDGDTGEPGLSVTRPVVEGAVAGADRVTTQYQPMEGGSVWGIISRSRLARLNSVQLMEAGVPGPAMAPVPSPVVVESSQEPGSVTILNLVLE